MSYDVLAHNPLDPPYLKGETRKGRLILRGEVPLLSKRGLGSRLRPDVFGMLDEIGMSYDLPSLKVREGQCELRSSLS